MTAIGCTVLLVEDNPGDVRLLTEAFAQVAFPRELVIAKDGVEALARLRREGEFAEVTYPDLILLDLNLPRKSGHAVLAEVKAGPALKRIPVIVLTTSTAEQDVLMSYDRHANCYITKPSDFTQFVEIVHAVKNFWLSIAALPTKSST